MRNIWSAADNMRLAFSSPCLKCCKPCGEGNAAACCKSVLHSCSRCPFSSVLLLSPSLAANPRVLMKVLEAAVGSGNDWDVELQLCIAQKSCKWACKETYTCCICSVLPPPFPPPLLGPQITRQSSAKKEKKKNNTHVAWAPQMCGDGQQGCTSLPPLPSQPSLGVQIQTQGLSDRFLSARRFPHMEDAHPEGDGRAGHSDNRRQRLEAIPAQHHRHPRGGGRLGTQVSQQRSLQGATQHLRPLLLARVRIGAGDLS